MSDSHQEVSEKNNATSLREKSWGYYYRGDYEKAFELAEQSLELEEKKKNKLGIATSYFLLGNILIIKGERDAGLDYAYKSLKLYEELDNKGWIAGSLWLVGLAYNFKGDYDQSIKFSKKSLGISEISDETRVNVLYNLGSVYTMKGEVRRALKYLEKGVMLAEEINNQQILSLILSQMGMNYWAMSIYEKGKEYLQRSLELSEKLNYSNVISWSLFGLILTANDQDLHDQAQEYLRRLEDHTTKGKSKFITDIYSLAKAQVLLNSGRTQNRAEGEILLRNITEEEVSNPSIYFSALAFYCLFLMEELGASNDLEILEELNPLINRYLKIAERTSNYTSLAMAKIFKAGVELIQMKFDEAKKLLTESLRIAVLQDNQRLAQYASKLYDRFLEQQDIWDNYKESNAPMADRIKLASINSVLDRLTGKVPADTPELIEEESVLLLITAEGGTLVFSNSFTEDVSFEEDLVSSFLSAFNTFSGELFSKGLDRAKFGEYMILMEVLNSFSICYMFKGQTYLARQKLTQFTESLKNEPSVLQALQRGNKTSQVLEPKDIPALHDLITTVFVKGGAN
jgi:hypothetical protein